MTEAGRGCTEFKGASATLFQLKLAMKSVGPMCQVLQIFKKSQKSGFEKLAIQIKDFSIRFDMWATRYMRK